MLRASLFRSRAFAVAVNGPRCGAQWLSAQRGSSAVLGQRFFADAKKTDESVMPVMPGSQSKDVISDIPPPPTITTPANPIDAPPPPQSVPKEPPTPESVDAAIPAPPPPPDTSTPPSSVPTGTGTASVAPPSGPTPPPPPPPTPRRRPRRFSRFLLTLLLLSTLGYAGGVYYSLINDNFHDFFTEYIPYGEDAVGYFEEREFRRRFSGTLSPRLHNQVRGENKVTIPSKSGISWKVAEDDSSKGTGLASKGRHVSALEDNKPEKDMALTRPEKTTAPEQTKAVEDAKKGAKEEKSLSHELMPKEAMKAESSRPEAPTSEAAKSQPAPKSEPAAPAPAPTPEPPKPAPIPLIDNIEIKSATEPVVQDVVKILNDIITVVNADNASDKYSSTIAKAKDDLTKVINDINTLRATEQKVAEDKIKNLHAEFDNAAKELIRRLENEMRDQEAHWKDEYESEREKLSQTYQNKLKSELEAAQKVYEQRLKNELLEEQIELKRDFTNAVRDRVETERNGRLSKLNELASSVEELERLTAEWNKVVDANLKTQHLLVAVEAVRTALEQADRPRPFVAELAALKEVAADDPVVSAAIASIPPVAYQRGIPTPAQLIDRFRRVAAEVRKAALLPENAGVASHAASLVLSKLIFKKQGAHGLPVGSDVESVLARAEMLLEEGNLDQAAREMNQLGGWAKMLCRDWLAECRKVLEVQQALDVITTEARLQSLLVD